MQCAVGRRARFAGSATGGQESEATTRARAESVRSTSCSAGCRAPRGGGGWRALAGRQCEQPHPVRLTPLTPMVCGSRAEDRPARATRVSSRSRRGGKVGARGRMLGRAPRHLLGVRAPLLRGDEDARRLESSLESCGEREGAVEGDGPAARDEECVPLPVLREAVRPAVRRPHPLGVWHLWTRPHDCARGAGAR